MMFKRKLLFFHIYIYKSILIFNKCFFWGGVFLHQPVGQQTIRWFFRFRFCLRLLLSLQEVFTLILPTSVDSVPGIFTLLETNSSHLKIHPWSRKGDSGNGNPSFFRGENVSFREKLTTLHLATGGPTGGPTLASRTIRTIRTDELEVGNVGNEPCHLGHRNVFKKKQQVDVHFHLDVQKRHVFYSMDTKWVSQALTTRFHVRSKHLFFTVSHVLTSFHLESGWHWCLVCGFPC